MLLRHYTPKILTALFGGLFVFAGFYTFGNALLFDRIFIGVLIFTALICRKNVNVLGVVVILVIQRLLEEAGWSISEANHELLVKAVFYGLALFVYYKTRFDELSKVFLTTITIALLSEAYWYFSDKSAPEIYWYVFVATNAFLVRYLVFVRVGFTGDYFPQKAESINLDWHIFKLYGVASFLQLIMIAEYIVRSVFGFIKITYVYYTYPYVAQALATYAVWVIFNESYRLLLPRLLKA
ncbi:hypothetical protein LJ739_10615 [Aestuariibacter halophilus]|uniref:Uncharacterized protein n=1 Tax=Fluctibacter halophilus TaxID=226011 RepID=A0ABS8G848_9ALTE|nr:hypothetical protein [Aestuariibacter halophilus]MCC2616693.1 hypothetical protein [Aestuariibacter halophilus]